MKILIVDDEEDILTSVRRTLKYKGFDEVEICSRSRKVLALIQEQDFDVVLLDIVMPEMGGLEILEAVKSQKPYTEFIIITGVDDIDTAVKALRIGAYDYLVKPLDTARVILSIERAYERKALSLGFSEMSKDHSCLEIPEAFSPIITRCPKMCGLMRYADIMARSGKSILITGETGTGKELFARSIHRAGSYGKGPFVPVNMASVPENLFESQFFGHAKGAYTGAADAAIGYFESANGGTLVLDEIGDLPPGLQVKLLRVLEEDQITRLGETTPRKVDVQILSSTNKDLAEACNSGAFRFDLYYRLSSAKIHIPPLRERLQDIPLLADYFCKAACSKYEKRVDALSPEVLESLTCGPYPGNVRELKQMVENAVLVADSPIPTTDHFPGDDATTPHFSRKAFTLKQNETAHIAYVMDLTHGNRSEAAKILGISLRHLHRKLAAMKKDGRWEDLFQKPDQRS